MTASNVEGFLHWVENAPHLSEDDRMLCRVFAAQSATAPKMVQVAWAKLGTHSGNLYVERWRRVDEGPNDYYAHPLYVSNPVK